MKLTEAVEDMYTLLQKRAEDDDIEAYALICNIEDRPTVKLKPCPFCGGHAEPYKEEDENWLYIQCMECGSKTDGYKKIKLAIESWNKRTTMLVRCPRCGAELTSDDMKGTNAPD